MQNGGHGEEEDGRSWESEGRDNIYTDV
jgi:hypothetical protein